ncbi:hypothetical protein [Saccharothrix lopnurensis]|uniref:Uncharacterized protein n=1 Tax=Saccharothrix lopnurensis TaxID=1670621 RepID=A0ABW1PDR4_9PSEU
MAWVRALLLTLVVWVVLALALTFLLGLLGSLGSTELWLTTAAALAASLAINRKRLRDALD